MKANRLLVLTAGMAVGLIAANGMRGQMLGWRLTRAVQGSSNRIDHGEVRAALAAGANPNANHIKGVSALTWAARVNDLEVLRMLIDAGADPNDTDGSGLALSWFAAYGNTEAIELLLNRGARPNNPGEGQGSHALVRAVSEKQVPAVRLLLARGASPHSRDRYKGSVLQIARKQGPPELVRLIRAAQAKEEQRPTPPTHPPQRRRNGFSSSPSG